MQNLCTKQLLRTTSTLVLHRQKNPSSKTDSILRLLTPDFRLVVLPGSTL